MSAESPKLSAHVRQSKGPCIVTPQQVTDPTILESVTGFINEVVPTTYNVPSDIKDQIQWVRFETIDEDLDHSQNLDVEKYIPPPLILVLGYTTGIQVWSIAANGDATEIISWRHGSVKVFKILPTPFKIDASSRDLFMEKRPLIALCDNVSPGPQYCTLSFLSLKTSEQVKLIKFKNPILDVLANKRSLVVSFVEKLAVFDAFTLEDRCTVTTCYFSPGINPNPIALGTRWLAYADKSLISLRKSCGGNESEGVHSYTATVLQAAKSLGKGLKEFSETVASSLTGNSHFKPGTSPGSPQAGGPTDSVQKGVITILDIENNEIDNTEKMIQSEAMVAHFLAHNEAIVCLAFDPSGMLLLSADKRGHDFHIFRIHPHPVNPSLTAVHHLYILHRGDTTAKVQDMCFSSDSRWVSVSTLRGTTHVFPVTPYGGNVGVRTHTTQHVVNKMSRYHRSAGLTGEGRSNSPVSSLDTPSGLYYPYQNPRFPPFPHHTVVHALAQIRQPIILQHQNSTQQRSTTTRQRLSSYSEENISLRVAACFAPNRAYLETQPPTRELPAKKTKTLETLFTVSSNGNLVQYDLEPHSLSNIPKEKVCDDTQIELHVSAKAQWILQRQPNSVDVPLPLQPQFLEYVGKKYPQRKRSWSDQNDDHWLSQVEIVTHAGPHRRLWMGPQFTFKTYTTNSGSPTTMTEAQQLDISRSKPVNMPVTKSNAILIESGSANSSEFSLDTYHTNTDDCGRIGDLQLKEDLADAMLESPGIKEQGGRCIIVSMKPQPSTVAKVVNPLGTVVTVQSDEESLEKEVVPEEIIHENCDETLFRPIVVPKPVFYAENKPKQHPADKMFVKNIDNPGMVVELLTKSNEKEPEKKIKNKVKLNRKNKKNDDVDSFGVEKIVKSLEGNVEDPLILIPDLPPIPKNDSFSCEEGKTEIKDDSDFASLDSTKCDIHHFDKDVDLKIDMFEDASDCCENLIYINTELGWTDPIDVEENKEERANVKPKKSKTKLLSERKSNKLGTDLNDDANDKVWGSKRSWSSVCAAKPKIDDKENELLEMINDDDDLIALNKFYNENCLPKQANIIEGDLLNLEVKSSDDEKIDSSPADTTESEELPEHSVNEIEKTIQEVWIVNQVAPSAKTTKKKSKKKRK